MSFTEKDKRVLVEVINHIQRAYVSDEAFDESESTKITLPCRLVRLTADTLGQTYQPAILKRLDAADIELLLTSLLKSVEAMKASLTSVIKALPEKLPAGMLDKLNKQVDGLEAMKIERETLSVANSLVESGEEMLVEKQELDGLRQRHEDLLVAQKALSNVDLDELRGEVARLEIAVGPHREEMERLEVSVKQKTAELESLTFAISEAKKVLTANDERAKEHLTGVVDLCSNLIAALDPHLAWCENKIQESTDTLAKKTAEGQQLKAAVQARISEVNEIYEETARISGALSLYTESNNRVARSVPTVLNAAKEKLSRIEVQLREVDGELKRALEHHQSAKHVVEVTSI
jgi:hypothetical protein